MDKYNVISITNNLAELQNLNQSFLIPIAN